MSTRHTTFRFTEDERILIDALRDYWTVKFGIPMDRTSTIRRLLRNTTPPTETTPEAAQVRRAHNYLFGERT